MTSRIVALVVANALMLAFGAGLLPFLRLARTRREVLRRLPLAYAVGIAGMGIVAAELALVHVPAGRIVVAALALSSLLLGLKRLPPGSPRTHPWRPASSRLPAFAALALVAVLLSNAARLFAVKPLLENDGWALWGLRARALYEFGHPTAPVFTDGHYPALQYPLFLPELEAIDARFMGTFDETLIHLQLLGIAIAFVGGVWMLLRDRAPSLLLACALLAIVTAPAFFNQLQTNSADVPLAMMISLGVACLAAWIRRGGDGLLPAATLFLTAGAMVKNEGELFALAAYIAAFAVVRGPRLRALVRSAIVFVALVAPWHLWLLGHGVTATTFRLSHLLDAAYLTSHWYRVESAQHQLLAQIRLDSSWSWLPLLVVVGLAGALLLRFRVAIFGLAWLALSFGGLLCVYWASPLTLADNLSNSADRTIDTLVIGSVLLVPVLLGLERSADRAPLESTRVRE